MTTCHMPYSARAQVCDWATSELAPRSIWATDGFPFWQPWSRPRSARSRRAARLPFLAFMRKQKGWGFLLFLSLFSLRSRTSVKGAPDNSAMASGVTVSDSVMQVFNDMKVRKCSSAEEVKKRKKAVLFCLSPDKKQVILEEGKEILVGDCCHLDDVYGHFIKMLPKDDCRYALYDATYETREARKEDLVFLFWAPEGAPLKSKMVYASTKDALRRKFTGIKHECQVNHQEDIEDRCTLANKLGPTVISLEGKPI